MRKGFIAVFLIVGSLIGGFNYFNLIAPMSQVISSDPRNAGIKIGAHYGSYIFPSVLVITVKEIDGNKTPADIFRLFLQYAEVQVDHNFESVELASNGRTKFVLEGPYFKELGKEYGAQNPVYTMRTFPQNLKNPDGTRAFNQWSGGLLGVATKQMEDFGEFHRQWYIQDMPGK